MDFVTHGIQGGSLYSVPVKLFFLLLGITVAPWLILLLFIYGFIEGAWPDAWDWVSAKLGWTKRWDLYQIYHKLPVNEKYKKYFAFVLHVKYVDPIFHKRPKHISQEVWDENKPGTRNWFKWLWWLAIIYWILDLVLLYVLIFW